MKAEMGQAGVRISEALGHSIGTRFFRVVALGALLVGAAALYSSMSQGEAVSSPASSAASLSAPASLYMGSQDSELAERAYDDLTENFSGVPVTTPAWVLSAYLVALDDATELAYDESSRSFLGGPLIAGKE